MKINKLIVSVALALAATAVSSCSGEKFKVSGNISDAKDSTLYFENMSLNGPVAIDSIKLGADGSFTFEGETKGNPEFYRLRIDRQIINIGVDSTESISVKASYPTMSTDYHVEGSEQCAKIKQLATMQTRLQIAVNAIAQNPNVTYQKEADSIQTVIEAYKNIVKKDFIFKEPKATSSYFCLLYTSDAADE